MPATIVENHTIHEIFAEACALPSVRAAVASGKPEPRLYRLSRKAPRGNPRSYRGFARSRIGEISLTPGRLCDEANIAILILHEIAHVVEPPGWSSGKRDVHGTAFKIAFLKLVEEMYGLRLYELARRRYHVADALAAKAVGRLLSESFGEAEPEEESAAWWVVEGGSREVIRYFSRTEHKAWRRQEEEKAAASARLRAGKIREERALAAASGLIR